MITIDDKRQIKNIISDFSTSITQRQIGDFRLKHKSLFIWCKWQEYINNIFREFPLEKDCEKLEEIVDYLEIENFSIDANCGLDLEEKRARQYIEKVLGRMKI